MRWPRAFAILLGPLFDRIAADVAAVAPDGARARSRWGAGPVACRSGSPGTA